MSLHMFEGTAAKKEREAKELEELRAKCSIIPYHNGYKIEGYFGKHATVEDAKRAYKILRSQ